MSYEVVVLAEGTDPMDITNLGRYDNQISEGGFQELRLSFADLVSQDIAVSFGDQLIQHGLSGYTSVRAEGNDLVLTTQKQLPIVWPVVALAVVALLIVWTLAFIGWKLFAYKPVVDAVGDTAGAFGSITKQIAGVPVLLWAALGVILIAGSGRTK